MTMTVTRLNHAVLYVRDARRTAAFYSEVLGFEPVSVDPGGAYAFMRAGGSSNHHDVAFFSIGAEAEEPAPPRSVGLYHLAWEVPTLAELDLARARLGEAGALVGASDHGVSKSVYAKDPDGLEFEVMWVTPPEQWGAEEHEAIVRPLDLAAEARRFGADVTAPGR